MTIWQDTCAPVVSHRCRRVRDYGAHTLLGRYNDITLRRIGHPLYLLSCEPDVTIARREVARVHLPCGFRRLVAGIAKEMGERFARTHTRGVIL